MTDLPDPLRPLLSPGARARAVAALLAGALGAVATTSLWWTEPGGLPLRTHLAFGLLTLFCLAWATYGTWLLTRKTPLFATENVVAAAIALAATLTTTTLLAVVALDRGSDPLLIVPLSVALVAVPAVLLARALSRRSKLLRRKRELGG